MFRDPFRCLIVVVLLGVPLASPGQPLSREEVLTRVESCRTLDSESDRLFCRYDVFERFGAVASLPPDQAEAFLLELGEDMDARSERECASEASRDREQLAQWAVRVWEHLIAHFQRRCGEDPTASCSQARVQRIHQTMHRYVRALLRRAAITHSGTAEVTYQLAWEFPPGYLDRALLRLWERSICDCSRVTGPRCSESGQLCRGRAASLCEQDDACGELWCEYGEKLAQLENLPSSFLRLHGRLSETARCSGVPEEDG